MLHWIRNYVLKTLRAIKRAGQRLVSPDFRLSLLVGNTVRSGPFQGMRYVDHALGSVLSAKLLGCYEKELHPWIERLIQKDYRQLFDIGCAEGYYAVGFAYRQPNLEVFAYDLDTRSLELVNQLARQNGVNQRIHWQGGFSQETLGRTEGRGKSLLICDIEGDEISLLDPEKIPELARLDMLIEVHDANEGTIERVLRKRFEQTHTVEKTVAQSRTVDEVPPAYRKYFSVKSQLRLVNEGRRYGLSWLLMTRR